MNGVRACGDVAPVVTVGPLAAFEPALRSHLSDAGYVARSVVEAARAMNHRPANVRARRDTEPPGPRPDDAERHSDDSCRPASGIRRRPGDATNSCVASRPPNGRQTDYVWTTAGDASSGRVPRHVPDDETFEALWGGDERRHRR